ncbi:MAG: hypothetical protein Phog2KO_25870 [Phototrophicaceae bacterium]
MHRHESWIDTLKNALPEQVDTERWTSSAYQIKFSQISLVDSQENPNASFRMSAWGLSTGLKHLLTDYSEKDIQTSADWLTIQQNAYVAVMLEDAMMSFGNTLELPMLDQIFISIDAELFLPNGLRMLVTCITNIVQVNDQTHDLDKFVAIVDPGEAQSYILERRGTSSSIHSRFAH